MRKLIDYIRSCFCNHDWELLAKVQIVASNSIEKQSDIPIGHKFIYRCKKCCCFRKIMI